MMKLLLLLFTLTSLSAFGQISTQADVKISIEDSVAAQQFGQHDYDLNDLVFCTNWAYQTDPGNATRIKKLTMIINPSPRVQSLF